MAKYPGRKVFILDSLSTGPELELLVEKYCELIKFGYAFNVIQERILEYLKRTHLLFSLESLSNFAKNGRASDEGELEPLHKCRGEKRAIGFESK